MEINSESVHPLTGGIMPRKAFESLWVLLWQTGYAGTFRDSAVLVKLSYMVFKQRRKCARSHSSALGIMSTAKNSIFHHQ